MCSRIPTFLFIKSIWRKTQGIQGTPMEHIGSSTNGKRVATVEAMQSSSSERAKHLGKTAVKIDLRLKETSWDSEKNVLDKMRLSFQDGKFFLMSSNTVIYTSWVTPFPGTVVNEGFVRDPQSWKSKNPGDHWHPGNWATPTIYTLFLFLRIHTFDL